MQSEYLSCKINLAIFVEKRYKAFINTNAPNRSKIFLSKVPIKLAHLNSAFIIFGVGMSLALLIFLVEIIVLNFIRHKRLIKKQETKEKIAPHLLSAPARLQLATIEVW